MDWALFLLNIGYAVGIKNIFTIFAKLTQIWITQQNLYV